MAIKRAEVFARRHGARIISITNEQAELIEHSTGGDACERVEGGASLPPPPLPPLSLFLCDRPHPLRARSMRSVLIQSSPRDPPQPSGSVVDVRGTSPLPPSHSNSSGRRVTNVRQRTYSGGIKKSLASSPRGYRERRLSALSRERVLS